MNGWWLWSDDHTIDELLIPDWGFEIMDVQRSDRKDEWGDAMSSLDYACPDTDW